jgi:putative membrane protein
VNSSNPAPSPHVTEHLANERTFLAWVRTALGLIGLGFVLARMGLFLRQLAAASMIHDGKLIRFQAGHEFLISGVVFLVIGTILCGWSARLYGQNRKAIDQGVYLPAEKSVLVISSLVVVGGLVIAAMVVLKTFGD